VSNLALFAWFVPLVGLCNGHEYLARIRSIYDARIDMPEVEYMSAADAAVAVQAIHPFRPVDTLAAYSNYHAYKDDLVDMLQDGGMFPLTFISRVQPNCVARVTVPVAQVTAWVSDMEASGLWDLFSIGDSDPVWPF
jgi:hypothetical protein